MMRIRSRQCRSNSASESVWATARAKARKAERDREKLRSPGSTLICRAIDLPRRLCHDRANQVIAGQGKQQSAGGHFRRLRLHGVKPHLFPEGQQIGLAIPALPIQRNYLFGRLGQSCEQIQVLIACHVTIGVPQCARWQVCPGGCAGLRAWAPIPLCDPLHSVRRPAVAAHAVPSAAAVPCDPASAHARLWRIRRVTVSDRHRAGREIVNERFGKLLLADCLAALQGAELRGHCRPADTLSQSPEYGTAGWNCHPA